MTAKAPRTPAGRPQFLTTAWTVVLSAAQEGEPGADDSLGKLCRTYWPPVFAFVRRQRYPEHDAEDLTQEFFARLIAERTLSRADRARGRFRSFLLGALQRFLSDEAARRGAQKRSAGCEVVSLHAMPGLALPPAPTATGSAEAEFEACWAWALLDAVLVELREEWAGEGRQCVSRRCGGSSPAAARLPRLTGTRRPNSGSPKRR